MTDYTTATPAPQQGGILLNDGHGHFTTLQNSFGPGQDPTLVLGDLDGDGFVDAVTGSNLVSGAHPGLVWWKNDGLGHLNYAATLVNSFAAVPALYDFNGDGRLDIVYDGLNILLNAGNGNFVAGGSLPGIATIYDIAAGSLANTNSGTVTEQGTPAGNLTSTGTLGFRDVDLTDVHLVSAPARPSARRSAASRRSRPPTPPAPAAAAS